MIPYDEMIYTGPVDEFFDYRFGKLPYRSLRVRARDAATQERFQPVGGGQLPERARLHAGHRVQAPDRPGAPEDAALVYEYPQAEGDPYYPVPRPENAELYKQYKALADATPDVHFVGRLATYKYYNMDQVVAQALAVYARIVGQKRAEAAVRVQTPVRTANLAVVSR